MSAWLIAPLFLWLLLDPLRAFGTLGDLPLCQDQYIGDDSNSGRICHVLAEKSDEVAIQRFAVIQISSPEEV